MPIRLLLLTLLFLASPVFAYGIWDRDTPLSQRQSQSDIEEVLTGKIRRFPPRYYELRLERVTRAIEKDRYDLPDYDDAAVACVRLGRFDDALAWMEKKRRAISELAEGKSRGHRFDNPDVLRSQSHRRMVNEAAISLYRWLAQGARADRVDEISVASGMISSARGINAGYSAERYLEMLVGWIIRAEKAPRQGLLPDLLGLHSANLAARGENTVLKDRGLSDCIVGLALLVRGSELLECVDVYYAMSLAFAADGKQSLAHFARLRVLELINAGKGSMVPGAPTGNALKALLGKSDVLGEDTRKEIAEEFSRRRGFAERWNKARQEFMGGKFDAGMESHPDTDMYFWAGFEEPSQLARELPPDTEKTPPVNAPRANQPANSTKPAKSAQDSADPMETVLLFVGAGMAICALIISILAGRKHRGKK